MSFSQISEKTREEKIKKFLGPLTLNMAICQLQMGNSGKALAIIDSLEKKQIAKNDPQRWNTLFKRGIVYDRIEEYDKSVYFFYFF